MNYRLSLAKAKYNGFHGAVFVALFFSAKVIADPLSQKVQVQVGELSSELVSAIISKSPSSLSHELILTVDGVGEKGENRNGQPKDKRKGDERREADLKILVEAIQAGTGGAKVSISRIGGEKNAPILRITCPDSACLDARLMTQAVQAKRGSSGQPFSSSVTKPWELPIDVPGRTQGIKYNANIRKIQTSNIFAPNAKNRFIIQFTSGGSVKFHFDIPEAILSAELKLQGSEDNLTKIPGKMGRMLPIPDFMNPFALGGDLVGGAASAATAVDRKYSMTLQGFHGDVTVHMHANEGRIEVDKAFLDQPLRFDKTHISLLKSRDALGAQFLNIFGGVIDGMIKDEIQNQMTEQGADLFVEPVKQLIQDSLFTAIPEKVAVPNPFQIQATAKMEKLHIQKGVATSLFSVDMNSGAEATSSASGTQPTLGSPGRDEVIALIPMALVKQLGPGIIDSGSMVVSKKKWGLGYRIAPHGEIAIEPLGQGDMAMKLPLDIRLNFGKKVEKLSGTLTAIVRPKVDPVRGLILDLKSANLQNLQGGDSFLGGLLEHGSKLLSTPLKAQIQAQLRAKLEQTPFFEAITPGTEGTELKIQKVNAGPDGIEAQFQLRVRCMKNELLSPG